MTLTGCDGSEALLPGRVPDLQLDTLAVQLDRADLEIYPDRRDETRRITIIAEPQQQTALSDTCKNTSDLN